MRKYHAPRPSETHCVPVKKKPR